MDDIVRSSYRTYIADKLEKFPEKIEGNGRLSATLIIYVARETKLFYSRLQAGLSKVFPCNSTDINNAATQAVVSYLKTVGVDVFEASKAQSAVDKRCPTIVDFISHIIATGEDCDDSTEELVSPQAEQTQKSNTGISGKFKRFSHAKKTVDEQQSSSPRPDDADDELVSPQKSGSSGKFKIFGSKKGDENHLTNARMDL